MNNRIKREPADKSGEHEFRQTMRALVRVQKAEVEEQERKEREAKARQRKKARA